MKYTKVCCNYIGRGEPSTFTPAFFFIILFQIADKMNKGLDPVSGLYPYDHYNCSTYNLTFNHTEKKCFSHYISTKRLRAEILTYLQQVCDYAHNNEEIFISRVREVSEIQKQETAKELQKQANQAEKRHGELDDLIKKLYESFAAGVLTEKRFQRLCDHYEQEQEALEVLLDDLQAKLNSFDTDTLRAEKFLALVQKYTDLSTLTAPMIYEFIEKILIYAPDKSTGERTQKIDIYLQHIGKFDLPAPMLTAEELEQLERDRERRAYLREKMRKQRAKEKQKTEKNNEKKKKQKKEK